METVTQTPFAVQADLTRALEREAASGGQLALTVKALAASDYGRLQFWGGDQVQANPDLERRWVLDDEERICVEAASADATLRCCVGFVAVEGHRPAPTAWLLDRSGAVFDIARQRRQALGFYGVALRGVEVSRWTEYQPHEMAITDARRLIA